MLVHRRSLQSFGLNCLAILSRAEHEIGQTVTQDGLFALVLIQGVQQSQCFVALLAKGAYRFAVGVVESGLRACQSGSKNALFAGDGDIRRGRSVSTSRVSEFRRV